MLTNLLVSRMCWLVWLSAMTLATFCKCPPQTSLIALINPLNDSAHAYVLQSDTFRGACWLYVQSSSLFLDYPEDAGTNLICKFGNYVPITMASYPGRLDSSWWISYSYTDIKFIVIDIVILMLWVESASIIVAIVIYLLPLILLKMRHLYWFLLSSA